MTSEKTAKRRRYSAEFKAQVVAQCDAPGTSVAKVAMSHGINANVVHGWRQLVRERGAAAVVPSEFIPVRVEAYLRTARCPARHRGRTAPWCHDDEDHLAANGERGLRSLDTRVAAVIRTHDQD